MRSGVLLEWGIIVLMWLWVTGAWLVYDPTTQLPGYEQEYLTATGEVAHQALRTLGRIPTWNPYFNWGEPLVTFPFGYVLNPLSVLPSLLVGSAQGAKWSAALYALMAALGGWYLGRTLGMGMAGRVLLALLLLGKGNMHMMIRMGYFQLGVQQAYFPWIIAGFIQVLRTHQRTPIILTALMTTLLFWAGNVWYILPMLISMAVLGIAHLPRRVGAWAWRLDGGIIRRCLLAGGLTLALGAAYTVPVALQELQGYIGAHADEIEAGWEITETWRAFAAYFIGDTQFIQRDLRLYVPANGDITRGWLALHYTYVVPYWLLLPLLFLVPFIYSYQRDQRAGQSDPSPSVFPQAWRVWLPAGGLVILFTMWAMGGTPLWEFLYEQIELLRGWRYVGRAFAVGAFWVALLAAWSFDYVWQILSYRILRVFAMVLVLMVGVDVNRYWYEHPQVIPAPLPALGECLRDLRQRHDTAFLTASHLGYEVMLPFIRYGVRHWLVEVDAYIRPDPDTLEPPMFPLKRLPSEFALVDGNIQGLLAEGFVPDSTSLPTLTGEACLLRHPLSLPYAFTLTDALAPEWRHLPAPSMLADWYEGVALKPVTHVWTQYDVVAAEVPASAEGRYFVVQQTAHAGWQVSLNGRPVPLDIIGGFIAVHLPPSETPQRLVFRYAPPLFYAMSGITLLSALACIGVLLRPKIVKEAPT